MAQTMNELRAAGAAARAAVRAELQAVQHEARDGSEERHMVVNDSLRDARAEPEVPRKLIEAATQFKTGLRQLLLQSEGRRKLANGSLCEERAESEGLRKLLETGVAALQAGVEECQHAAAAPGRRTDRILRAMGQGATEEFRQAAAASKRRMELRRGLEEPNELLREARAEWAEAAALAAGPRGVELHLRAAQDEVIILRADNRRLRIRLAAARNGGGAFPCRVPGCGYRFYKRFYHANNHMHRRHGMVSGDKRLYLDAAEQNMARAERAEAAALAADDQISSNMRL